MLTGDPHHAAPPRHSAVSSQARVLAWALLGQLATVKLSSAAGSKHLAPGGLQDVGVGGKERTRPVPSSSLVVCVC